MVVVMVEEAPALSSDDLEVDGFDSSCVAAANSEAAESVLDALLAGSEELSGAEDTALA